MKMYIAPIIAFGFALNVQVLVASPIEQIISLDQVRAYALAKGLESKRIDRDTSIKLADALELESRDLPTLSFEAGVPVDYDSERPRNELHLSLEQPLRLSDFGLRSKVADLLREVTEVEKQGRLRELIQKISLSYYRLWALRKEKSHILAQHKAAVRVARVLADSASQGVSSAVEVKISLANRARLKADLLGIDHEIRKAETALTRLAAVNLQGKELKRPEISQLRSLEEMLQAAREHKFSFGQRAEIRLRLAEEQSRLARQDSYPALVPKLSYSRNEEGVDFVGIGISFDLPFNSPKRADVLRKQGEKSYKERQRQYVLGKEFEVEFKSFYEQVESKVKQATMYEKEVLPPLSESVHLSEEAFESAQLPLLQLWTVQSEYHQAIDRSTELWIEAYASLTEMSLLTGELEL